MKRSDLILSLLLMLLGMMIALVIGLASAQKATEVFIPINESPGLSKEGKTLMGEIEQLFPPRSFKIKGQIVITFDHTKFYIDYSHLKQPRSNGYGKFEDLKVGSFVEVYVPLGMTFAEWVKMRGAE